MRRVLGSLALSAAVLLAGCGLKGPLYLPDKNVRVITTPETQSAPVQGAPAQPAVAQSKPPPPASPQEGAAPPEGSASPAAPKRTDQDADSGAAK